MGNNLTGSSENDVFFSYKTILYPELGTINIYESLRNSYMQIKFDKNDDQYKLWADKVDAIKTRCLSYLLHPIGY